MLKKKKVKCKPCKSNKKLYSYGSEEPLNTGGEFEAELCYKDRQCAACFVIVEEKTRPILSQQTSELLAILKIEINSVSEENLQREFEGIFNLLELENSEPFRPNFMLMNQSSRASDILRSRGASNFK